MKKDYLMVLGAGVALLILIVAAVLIFNNPGNQVVPVNQNQDSQNNGDSAINSNSPAAPASGGSSVEQALTYEQALNIYKDRRIQFNNQCQASPTSIVLKNGTNIMLDNRFGFERDIRVDGTLYRIAAYGFKIVELKNNTLPYDVIIDCGSGRNNARVTIN